MSSVAVPFGHMRPNGLTDPDTYESRSAGTLAEPEQLSGRLLDTSAQTAEPAFESWLFIWLPTVRSQLEELLLLRRGWDGYGGEPPRPEAVLAVLEVLQDFASDRITPPDLLPLSDGSVRLEWFADDIEVGVDVANRHEVSVHVYDPTEGTDWEGPLADDRVGVDKVLRKLTELSRR